MSAKPFIDILTEGKTLPEGCDRWAFRSVHADLTSRNGFQYPMSGRVEAPGPILPHADNCPRSVGDGLCVAHDCMGAASGGVPLHSVLLVAYSDRDALGSGVSKTRVAGMVIVQLIDAWRLLRENGARADLRYANLSGANLSGAKLYSADLYSAKLYSANLSGADLRYADLSGADLSGADLYGADLYSANLRYANLRSADLSGAYLYSADLRSADLSGADLRGANLHGAYLHGALTDEYTRLPDGVKAPK